MSTKEALPKQGYPPDLQGYLNKTLLVHLKGGRQIQGKVIGYDKFMNLSLDEACENDNNEARPLFKTMIRGSSIEFWECIDKVE